MVLFLVTPIFDNGFYSVIAIFDTGFLSQW